MRRHILRKDQYQPVIRFNCFNRRLAVRLSGYRNAIGWSSLSKSGRDRKQTSREQSGKQSAAAPIEQLQTSP